MPGADGGTGKPVRKPAKRGPTKAAALKALGLTQEDLNTLKQLAELKAAVDEAQSEAQREDVQVSVALTPEAEEIVEQRGSVDIGQSAAAPQAVGTDHPESLTSEEPVWYMRNLRGVDVAFRLTRQEDTRKRTTLKPRGQRGDLVKLSPEDLKDSELRTQIAYDLVEIIPEGEALSIIDKQSYNASQPGVRPLESMLRNSKGDEMPGGVHTDALPFEQQGITVARLNPQDNSPTGELPSQGRGIDWAAARNIGGNPAIISDGFAEQAQSPEAAAKAAAVAKDAVARRKGGERSGPSRGGMEGMKVTVDPVQKT